MLNFTWWVNRKDPSGRNVFEGGFLGLDNIGVFDRSATLPDRRTASSRPTAPRGWRCSARTCSSWLSSSPSNDPATKTSCSSSSSTSFGSPRRSIRIGEHPDELWDEEDGFFYDVLRLPGRHADNGSRSARSSGCCRSARSTVIEPERARALSPSSWRRIRQFLERNRDLLATIADPQGPATAGAAARRSSTRTSCAACSTRMLDEERFLGPHGIRSLSRWHLDHPYRFDVDGRRTRCSTSRPSRPRACSAATRTGAVRCGSRSTC